MIATKAGIFNQALTAVGANLIADPDDDDEGARACRTYYDQAVDDTLAAWDWPFATERALLSAVDGPTLSQFAYRYQLPEDPFCLRVSALLNAADASYEELPQEPWVKEGRRILTDQSPCAIKYVMRIVDPAQFDTRFVEALKWKLASLIVLRLTKKPALENAFEQRFELALARAQWKEADEAAEDEPPTKWSEAR